LEGFNARIFQHEFDHLDKILFIDRFNEADKAENQKRLDKVGFKLLLFPPQSMDQ
jgi:peptide deformylase